jgi:ankyrin repeat protein
LIPVVVAGLLLSGCNQSGPPLASSNQSNAVAVAPTPVSENAQKLFKAIRARDSTQVRLLVKEDPSLLQAQGEMGTPLHAAANGPGDAEITRLLLKSGADVNAVDDRGYTPLKVAVRGRSSEEKRRIVDILLSNGADVDTKSRGGGATPLHIASLAGNITVVKMLLAHKADVNATDSEGKTALQRIVAMRQQLNKGDNTARALSRVFEVQNYLEIANLLRQSGGK